MTRLLVLLKCIICRQGCVFTSVPLLYELLLMLFLSAAVKLKPCSWSSETEHLVKFQAEILVLAAPLPVCFSKSGAVMGRDCYAHHKRSCAQDQGFVLFRFWEIQKLFVALTKIVQICKICCLGIAFTSRFPFSGGSSAGVRQATYELEFQTDAVRNWSVWQRVWMCEPQPSCSQLLWQASWKPGLAGCWLESWLSLSETDVPSQGVREWVWLQVSVHIFQRKALKKSYYMLKC